MSDSAQLDTYTANGEWDLESKANIWFKIFGIHFYYKHFSKVRDHIQYLLNMNVVQLNTHL
jgi:hypothetical protein